MASTMEYSNSKTTAQPQRDELPPSSWRPPRRVSTLQYEPPSASSSDSDWDALSASVVGPTRSRIQGKKTPWYKKMRLARDKATMRENQTLPPPQPLNPVRTNHDGTIDVEEEVERSPSLPGHRSFWRLNRGRGKGPTSLEEYRSDPERSRTWYGAPIARSTYSSYYYTDSLDEEEESTSKIRVFHYDVQESGIRSNPGQAYFDSSKVEPEKTGRERRSHVFQRKVIKAFNDAISHEAPNKVKLILIHNNQEAMVSVIRNNFSDSHWSRRYGEELISRVESFRPDYQLGPPTKKAQFFRILHDEERNMVQSAFCINHWVIPLEDDSSADSSTDEDEDEDDRLQQLVVYWQYHWTAGKSHQGVERDSTEIATGEEGDQTDAPTRVEATSGATRISPTKKTSKGSVAASNVDLTKEPLFNSNLIVIFERSRIRNRHRRSRKSVILDGLTDFVPSNNFAFRAHEGAGVPDFKERLVSLHIVQMLKYVIETVCDILTDNLDDTIDSYSTQRARLAEKVYQKPEDDNVASTLWVYSRAFQNAGKIINLLALLVDDIRSAFGRHLDDRRLSESFLADLPHKFRTLSIDVEEELQKPTAEMIDLVYKSVSIKDARLSLELNSSLWRLSWVTFIFLPLTFLAGFFGMNVDTFANDPSIKWYFIVAVPFLISVIVSWLVFKFCMKRGASTNAKPSYFSIGSVVMTLALILGMRRRSRTRSRRKQGV